MQVRMPDRFRSAAVLIGTGRYESAGLPALPAVENNLARLAQVLTDPIYGCVDADACQTLLDPVNGKVVSQALRAAGDRAEDMLLMYFVGHGIVGPDDGELYLALPGTEVDSPGFSALRYADVRRLLRDGGTVRSANRIVIIDCCFSGRAIPTLAGEQLTGFVDIEGVYVLTSASANSRALAPEGALYTTFTVNSSTC